MIIDIIDKDFARVLKNDISYDYFVGEMFGFLTCEVISLETFDFVLFAVPLDCIS